MSDTEMCSCGCQLSLRRLIEMHDLFAKYFSPRMSDMQLLDIHVCQARDMLHAAFQEVKYSPKERKKLAKLFSHIGTAAWEFYSFKAHRRRIAEALSA